MLQFSECYRTIGAEHLFVRRESKNSQTGFESSRGSPRQSSVISRKLVPNALHASRNDDAMYGLVQQRCNLISVPQRVCHCPLGD